MDETIKQVFAGAIRDGLFEHDARGVPDACWENLIPLHEKLMLFPTKGKQKLATLVVNAFESELPGRINRVLEDHGKKARVATATFHRQGGYRLSVNVRSTRNGTWLVNLEMPPRFNEAIKLRSINRVIRKRRAATQLCNGQPSTNMASVLMALEGIEI